jgi:hypothetical protein
VAIQTFDRDQHAIADIMIAPLVRREIGPAERSKTAYSDGPIYQQTRFNNSRIDGQTFSGEIRGTPPPL